VGRTRLVAACATTTAPTIERPSQELLALGDDLPGQPEAHYKRRIGTWLLWRAGPATGGDARYWACRADDLTRQATLRLYPDGSAAGLGADGQHHDRFRSWKQSLLADG
jgi:hypothetical protein